ncbi:hypothetical protein CF319_g7542 [Tilletia indica]|nr:hypothetical protein CF319_g7542 [Tilletia indica]
MSTVRPVKTPTDLTITTDSVYGDSIINNGLHESDACIYDVSGQPYIAKVIQSAPSPPPEGTCIVTQQAVSTQPLYIHINEPSSVRLVPEQVDGTTPDNQRLKTSGAHFSGIGVLCTFNEVNRTGIIVGRVSSGKKFGMKNWKIRTSFDVDDKACTYSDEPKNNYLVSFDGTLVDIDEEDRITTIMPAPLLLLQSFGVAEENSGGRAAHIRSLRAAGSKQENGWLENNRSAASSVRLSAPAPQPLRLHPVSVPKSMLSFDTANHGYFAGSLQTL